MLALCWGPVTLPRFGIAHLIQILAKCRFDCAKGSEQAEGLSVAVRSCHLVAR